MAALSITVEQAIEAARNCSKLRASLRWSEEHVSVKREAARGRDCWIVSTDAASDTQPGEPSWFDVFTDTRMDYMVDARSGNCIGVRVGQTYHHFPPDSTTRPDA